MAGLTGDLGAGGVEAREIKTGLIRISAGRVSRHLTRLRRDPTRVRSFGHPRSDGETGYQGEGVRPRKTGIGTGRDEVMGIDLVGAEQRAGVVHPGVEEAGDRSCMQRTDSGYQ